jgi:transcriptional regulator with XRE-family HTH domain
MLASTSNTSRWCLASIRQSKGVSLEEIAGRTKLRVAVVRAIEEGNFDELPGGIYNISYLRQYAREIGADENLLVGWYQHGYVAPANGVAENDTLGENDILVEVQQRAPTHEEIAERARELWQLRGCPEGNAEEDWLKAEQELRSPAT